MATIPVTQRTFTDTFAAGHSIDQNNGWGHSATNGGCVISNSVSNVGIYKVASYTHYVPGTPGRVSPYGAVKVNCLLAEGFGIFVGATFASAALGAYGVFLEIKKDSENQFYLSLYTGTHSASTAEANGMQLVNEVQLDPALTDGSDIWLTLYMDTQGPVAGFGTTEVTIKQVAKLMLSNAFASNGVTLRNAGAPVSGFFARTDGVVCKSFAMASEYAFTSYSNTIFSDNFSTASNPYNPALANVPSVNTGVTGRMATPAATSGMYVSGGKLNITGGLVAVLGAATDTSPLPAEYGYAHSIMLNTGTNVVDLGMDVYLTTETYRVHWGGGTEISIQQDGGKAGFTTLGSYGTTYTTDTYYRVLLYTPPVSTGSNETIEVVPCRNHPVDYTTTIIKVQKWTGSTWANLFDVTRSFACGVINTIALGLVTVSGTAIVDELEVACIPVNNIIGGSSFNTFGVWGSTSGLSYVPTWTTSIKGAYTYLGADEMGQSMETVSSS
jgi:hypothetical protein